MHSETVRRFFDAVKSRNYPDVETFFAEDARWWFAQSAVDRGLIPQRCAEDRVAIMDFISRAPTNYRRNDLTILHLLQDGDMVAAHIRGEGETQAGKQHSHEYVFMFEFRDESIVEVWEFLDTAYIFARFQ